MRMHMFLHVHVLKQTCFHMHTYLVGRHACFACIYTVCTVHMYSRSFVRMHVLYILYLSTCMHICVVCICIKYIHICKYRFMYIRMYIHICAYLHLSIFTVGDSCSERRETGDSASPEAERSQDIRLALLHRNDLQHTRHNSGGCVGRKCLKKLLIINFLAPVVTLCTPTTVTAFCTLPGS